MVHFRFLNKVASWPGVLYVLTRFGGKRGRCIALDRYYVSGEWDYFENAHSREIVKVVETYARGGRILEMGCGPGGLAKCLDSNSFAFYLGVDASPEAMRRAWKLESDRMRFEVGEIQTYRCREKYDVIVFDESLYYAPFFRRRLLRRYAASLLPGGHFVVTVAHPGRFAGMIRMIRKNFTVVEDRSPSLGSKRVLLVFR